MNNANKPVYPTKGATYKTSGDPNRIDLDYPEHSVFKFGGLTKREYFAAMAMQGLLAVNDKGNFDSTEASISEGVRLAIIAADELLKQLES